MEKNASCADCGVVNCNAQDKEYPEFCLTTNLDEGVKKEALLEYEKEANKKVSLAAAEVEYEGYCIKTRVEEIMEFAKKLGITKIGIATCVGLIRETHAFAKILRAQGFEVYAVACKVGVVPKVDIA